VNILQKSSSGATFLIHTSGESVDFHSTVVTFNFEALQHQLLTFLVSNTDHVWFLVATWMSNCQAAHL